MAGLCGGFPGVLFLVGLSAVFVLVFIFPCGLNMGMVVKALSCFEIDMVMVGNFYRGLLFGLALILGLQACKTASDSSTQGTTDSTAADAASAMAAAEGAGWVSLNEDTASWSGFNAQGLAAAIKEGQYGLSSVLVMRNGEILAEGYFGKTVQDGGANYVGVTQDTRHLVNSAGVLLTGAVVGYALAQGYLGSMEDELLPYFADYAGQIEEREAKAGITLHHVLSMAMGLGCDDWGGATGRSDMLNEVDDDFLYVLNLPVVNAPGEAFAYCAAGVNLLGGAIQQRSGKDFSAVAGGFLSLLNIEGVSWLRTDDKVPYDYAGGGVRMTTRDMAALGSLFANEGAWQGKQVLPAAWVQKCLQPYQRVTATESYGYGLYLREVNVGTATYLAAEASGDGLNRVTILPELGLVVVLTGGGVQDAFIEEQQGTALLDDYIFAAIR